MWPWLCLCSAVVSEEELDIPFLRWTAPLGTGQERENSSELLSPHPVSALQSTWVTDSLLKTGSSVAAAVKINLDKCMVIVFLFGYLVRCLLVWTRPSAMVLQRWGPVGTWRSQPTHLPQARLPSRARMQHLYLWLNWLHLAKWGTSSRVVSSPVVFCRKGGVVFFLSSQLGRGNQEAWGAWELGPLAAP